MRQTTAPPTPLAPAQERVWHDLLAVGRRRPRTDPTTAPRLRQRLEAQTTEAAALVPDRDRLWLNRSALAALECDGRFLDRADTPFVWTVPAVRGQLAHVAIEVDCEGGRRRDPDEVLAFAWAQVAARGDGAGRFLAGLDGPEADALRADVRKRLLGFRECFPLLPARAHARTAVPFTVSLHGGRVVVKSVADLVVGRATATHRRMQLIDLKSGPPSAADRHERRLSALCATLKLGVAPFRTATYYLDEAAWDHDDVDAFLLEEEVARLVGQVRRAAVLTYRRPAEDALRLRPGPACGWCGRAPDCLPRVFAHEQGALEPAPAERP